MVFVQLRLEFLKVLFFNDFCPKIANAPLYPIEKSKTSIFPKTSHRGAKQSEIWDSWLMVQHIRGAFGLLTFKVILRSFGELSIFHKIEENILSGYES